MQSEVVSTRLCKRDSRTKSKCTASQPSKHDMVPKWYHGRMANLSLKDLPDTLHRRLKAAAKQHGRSLNSYIIQVLQTSEQDRLRRERKGRSRNRLAHLSPTLPVLREL